MPFKELLGALVGGLAGYGYHVLMRCVGSNCINRRFPMVPIVTLAGVGGWAAWRWWA